MYTVGIVGCGVIGNRLAETFTDHAETTVHAACDLDEAKLDAFVTEYDCERFTDHRSLVGDDSIDIVYVGVPPVHHRDVVLDALDAEKHVICEKPIAEHAGAGEEMVEAARRSDRTTAVNLPFRYTAGFVEMRERIERGAIGDPKRVMLRFRFPEWPREWQDVDWLRGREQGGPLREVGTHFLFGTQELFGPIDEVCADVRYTAPDRYEESIVGHFTVDGVHGIIDLLCDHDAPEENSITVEGTESSLSLTEWYKLIERPDTDAASAVVDDRIRTTMRLVDEFVTELDGGDGDLVSFGEATSVQRVVDAVFADVVDGSAERSG